MIKIGRFLLFAKKILEIFGTADGSSDCSSGNHQGIGQISITIAHASGHVAIGSAHHSFASGWSARTGFDTSAAARLFDQRHPGPQKHIMKAQSLTFLSNLLRSILDIGRYADLAVFQNFHEHGNRCDVAGCTRSAVNFIDWPPADSCEGNTVSWMPGSGNESFHGFEIELDERVNLGFGVRVY